jgi:hypothetical protein
VKLWFNKKQKNNKGRSNTSPHSQQRLYSYYTASRRQIDQFERTNQQTRQQSNNTTVVKSFRSNLSKVLIYGLVIIMLLMLFGLSNKPSLSIGGTKYQDIKTYTTDVANILKQDKRNMFKPSLQADYIKQEIIKKFPEASKVEVYAPLIGMRPIIKITTNLPLAVLIQPNANSLIIDQTGRAVAEVNNSILDSTKLSVIENQTGLDYSINDQIFSPNEISALLTLHQQIQLEGDNLIANYIMPSVPREIRLKRAGYFVKFGLDDSSGAGTDLQYGSLKSIEKSIQEQGTTPPSEYIDVRLGDKVYIK